ncbi:hypothetical protein HMPREF1575_00838 [Gardnerella vaginalis JCP7672]|nr:hypothetical protein HMPREF1575_00838 [Gardnerella vaginalis JCP7672]EPI55885.1 hypothetical protein HMPREF1572_00937 [Gardnerella vaginalis JCP7275]
MDLQSKSLSAVCTQCAPNNHIKRTKINLKEESLLQIYTIKHT